MARKRKKKQPSKMEAMLERYGTAALVSWFSIFFSSIALFFVLLEVGTDVDALVEKVVGSWGGDPSAWTEASAGAGQLGLAYLATQVVKPIRIALFVAFTPVVARFMGTTKAVPPLESASSAEPAAADGEPDAPAEAQADATEDAPVSGAP